MASLISKFKGGSSNNGQPPPLEYNPIMQFFEIGPQIGNGGTDHAWHIHEAKRKSDNVICSVFIFDKRLTERLFKSKRKENMLERIRSGIAALERWRHPRMLQVYHSLEEGNNTMAFASEPILGSLYNILAYQDSLPLEPGSDLPVMPYPASMGPHGSQPQPQAPSPRAPFAKEYVFLDMEIRYGFQQMIDALNYLHYKAKQVHRNVCPENIFINKRGTWKLFGLEFLHTIINEKTMVPVAPWSIKAPKISQPCLDFIAPEVQTSGHCTTLSDMFSLGLVMCTVFNKGKQLIQANYNPMLYLRQSEYLERQVEKVVKRVPAALQEALQRLTSRDPNPRPTTQLLPLIKYFNYENDGVWNGSVCLADPRQEEALTADGKKREKCVSEIVIEALQFLDSTALKDPNRKIAFFRTALPKIFPAIPKKLRWMNVWPALRAEWLGGDVMSAVLESIMWLVNDSSEDEFNNYILPAFLQFLTVPKSMQALLTLMENFATLVKKCPEGITYSHMMPFLYSTMDSNTNQIQAATLICLHNLVDFLDEAVLATTILPKVKIILEGNQGDVKIINLVLGFFEKTIVKMDRSHVLDQVIPTLLCMRLGDPGITHRVVMLYKSLIVDKKFALTTSVMATRMIPTLAPQTINPALNIDQFTNLMEIIYDMLDNIDQSQRYILKLEKTPSVSDRYRALRLKASSESVNAPPFNIPNLRVEQRKTSSAEDMVRKNSVSGTPTNSGQAAAATGGGFKSTGIGQWFFGSNNSTNSDSNFLRVASVFPNRRLSDNTLMTPKIRIAPSCASSPGGTPGGSNSALPARRHSSIGPQERRGSAVNLSPPTGYQSRGRGGSGSSLSVPATSQYVGGSMPNTSSSVPFLLTSSMQSIRSRRPSVAMGGSQGSGILQQISSGMVRHLPAGSHPSVQVTQPRLPNWSAGYNALTHHTAMAVRKCPSLNINITR